MCLLLAGTSAIYAQTVEKGLAVEISSGVGSGWWLYNRGSTHPAILNDQGWDRTSHSPFWNSSISLIYRFQKISAGLHVQYDLFLEDKMRAFDDRDAVYSRYKIADNAVPLVRYGMQFEVMLLKKRRYSLSPAFSIGAFTIDTRHPQAELFNDHRYLEFSLSNEIYSRRFSLIVKPQFKVFSMTHRAPVFFNERHELYNFGAVIGFRWWVFCSGGSE